MMMKLTDNPPLTPLVSAPLFGNFEMMSLSCNGLLTTVRRGKKRVPRYKMSGQYVAPKQFIFWVFSDYKTLLSVVVLSLLFFAPLKNLPFTAEVSEMM